MEAERCGSVLEFTQGGARCEGEPGHEGPHHSAGSAWLAWKVPVPALPGCQECRILRTRVAELEATVRTLGR